jgi:hypothetical protein
MRVFILCTGRSGSTTIIKACKSITNYTCGHETLAHKLGDARFDYPDNHVEADNRLSWFLGILDKKYGDGAIYVHLIREKDKVVESYNKRWKSRLTIVKAFTEGILMTPIEKLDEKSRLTVCSDYYDAVNSNIELFLKDKTKKITINLKDVNAGFGEMWSLMGAQGNWDKAIELLGEHYNRTEKKGIANRIKARIKFYYNIYLGK